MQVQVPTGAAAATPHNGTNVTSPAAAPVAFTGGASRGGGLGGLVVLAAGVVGGGGGGFVTFVLFVEGCLGCWRCGW